MLGARLLVFPLGVCCRLLRFDAGEFEFGFEFGRNDGRYIYSVVVLVVEMLLMFSTGGLTATD